jgi:hypothetical protein
MRTIIYAALLLVLAGCTNATYTFCQQPKPTGKAAAAQWDQQCTVAGALRWSSWTGRK